MPNMTGRSLQRRLKKRSKTCPRTKLATLTSSRVSLSKQVALRWKRYSCSYSTVDWRSHAHSLVPGSHSEPFKAGDTQQPGNYRGITLVSICRKMFTNILRAPGNDGGPARSAAAFRSKRSCADQQFVLAQLDRRLVRLERRCTRSFGPAQSL
jgi:hypothetical protein